MKLLWQAILILFMVMECHAAHAVIVAEANESGEPDIVEIQRVALEYHNIERDEVSRWKKRARLSALLPRFQVSYDRRIKNDVDINISENVYVGSSGVTVGPEDGTYAQNANSDQNVGVRAVWYLNELIFNPEQLDISRESRSLMHERQALMAELNKHYYERERVRGVISALESGKLVPLDETVGKNKKTKKAVNATSLGLEYQLFLARVKFDEETAALDALTGGWFSQRIGK